MQDVEQRKSYIRIYRGIGKQNKIQKNKGEYSKAEGLYGKNLALVGYGNIGKEVAKRASAMGMTVIAYDPYVKESADVKLVSLDELLAQADYISLHLPKTKESAGMIGKAQFEKMKTGVRLINCARGGIVNEEALFEALTSGKDNLKTLQVVFAEYRSMEERRAVSPKEVIA